MRPSARLELFSLLARLWRHASPRRQVQFAVLVVLMLASAFAEVLTLGAVLPFLGVLVSPERVFQHPAVARVAAAAGINTAAELVLPLTVLFVVAAVVAGVVRLAVLWASTKFSFAVGIDLGLEMYRRTLYQPYRVHVARNSSEVVTGIITKTSAVIIQGVALPSLQFISSSVVVLAIVIVSLAIDATVAAWAAVGFGVCYGLVTIVSRRRLEHNSRHIASEQTQLLKTLNEGLGGIRDVLLDGTQELYTEIYRKADRTLRISQASNTFISGSPRFAMEALGMALLALIAYKTVVSRGTVEVSIPVLGALALGAQRLIPALQQSYSSWATIAGSAASLADTLELLDQPLPPEATTPPPAPLRLENSIEFDQVSFRYSPEGPSVLDRLVLKIQKGTRVGIVGLTGSGKSTAVDLLMGLLEPTAGNVLIDGKPLIGPTRRAWQRAIAHVPQSVYLADASIAENIAFGVPPSSIDMDAVRMAARQAQIADFIESSPYAYEAMVGERGVRLSGGQRQRIGIARALYKNASVLLFDEATSALDSVTEQAVIDAIARLGSDLTIVIIAHRLTTLQNCDAIVEINGGRVVGQGTYDELLRDSATFHAMATQSSKNDSVSMGTGVRTQ